MSSSRPGLSWIAWRLGRALVAEIASAFADWLPRPLARPLRRLALRLEKHCESAALADALDRFGDDSTPADVALESFERLLRQVENPWNTSASDLHLARLPGRLRRSLGGRLVWGSAVAGPEGWAILEQTHASTQRHGFRKLARGHFERALGRDDPGQARRALDVWDSLDGRRSQALEPPSLRRARAELAWREGERATALDLAAPWLEQGRCPSPFDVLDWGLRALESDRLDLAQRCFERAREWLPEARRTWRLGAALARIGGRREEQVRWLDRALARNPQDLDSVLHRLALDHGDGVHERLEGDLVLEAPSRLTVGATGELTVRQADSASGPANRVLVLPPAGFGLTAEPVDASEAGEHRFRITAQRGDRVRGKPWPLVAVVASAEGHRVAETTIAVPDESPPQILLVATEDHEIHEERGELEPAMLERLLVDKSRLAADQAASVGVPWTHCVEAGSTLAMTDWAACSEGETEAKGETWRRLRAAVRCHLAEEVSRGHDLQPHLHTFNDPFYGHFPFAPIDSDPARGWRPSLRFLLTGAEARGDWASVTPPPGAGSNDAVRNRTPPPGPTLDRLSSTERAVAQVEDVARLGSPDHRPLLWRSGLLEYGDSREERAWSAVALRRAGLLAASDLAKPAGSGPDAVPPAFPCGWAKPFDPVTGGPLIQLPIVANTEGDYRMDSGRLARRARASVAAVADRPGVHCFTLLTHDKFINARFGADEFQNDPTAGEWPLIRQHLEAWTQAGARPVTAGEAVHALVDDLGWHPEPRLTAETFLLSPDTAEGTAGDVETSTKTVEIEYRVDVLGPRPAVDPDRAFPWRIPVPCSLRRGTNHHGVATVTATFAGSPIAIEVEEGGLGEHRGVVAVWVAMPRFPDLATGRETGLQVRFALRCSNADGPGPRFEALHSKPSGDGSGGWELVLAAPEPFLSARVLLPWSADAAQGPTAEVGWGLESPALGVEPTEEGLLISGIRFEADALGGAQALRLPLEPVQGPETTPGPGSRAEQLEETPA